MRSLKVCDLLYYHMGINLTRRLYCACIGGTAAMAGTETACVDVWMFEWSDDDDGCGACDVGFTTALEKEAKERDVRKTRTVSEAEEKYLRVLVRAYGEDVEKMSRDRKRNAMQYTPGQLRRAICSAGGYERLGLGLTQTSTTYS